MVEQRLEEPRVGGSTPPPSADRELVHVSPGSLIRIIRDDVVITWSEMTVVPKGTVLTVLGAFSTYKNLRGDERGQVRAVVVFCEGRSLIAHLFEDEFEIL